MSRKYGFKIKGKEIIVKKKMNGREGQGDRNMGGKE